MESTFEQDVNVDEKQKGSNWWSVLGFISPMVGLILFLVWKTSYPKSSKAAGRGALASVAVKMLVAVFASTGNSMF